jgi:hypothetical protein
MQVAGPRKTLERHAIAGPDEDVARLRRLPIRPVVVTAATGVASLSRMKYLVGDGIAGGRAAEDYPHHEADLARPLLAS